MIDVWIFDEYLRAKSHLLYKKRELSNSLILSSHCHHAKQHSSVLSGASQAKKVVVGVLTFAATAGVSSGASPIVVSANNTPDSVVGSSSRNKSGFPKKSHSDSEDLIRLEDKYYLRKQANSRDQDIIRLKARKLQKSGCCQKWKIIGKGKPHNKVENV